MSILRHAAVLLLGLLAAPRATHAQAPEPGPAAPEQAPAAGAADLAAPQLSSPSGGAPPRLQLMWNDLRVIQERDAELWSERYSHALGLPATGIIVGTPLTLLLVPWGGVLLADANAGYDDYDGDSRLRRAGAIMVTSGLLTLGAVIVSIWQVSRVRRRRHAIDSELRALSATRTSIERMLELQATPLSEPAR
jgi:hypothetical protein